jgi:hypothetical protein
MRYSTRKLSTVATLAALVVLAGCEKRQADQAEEQIASDSSREGHSMVRLVNAVAGPTTVDVYADDANTFTGVEFKTVTPYKTVKDNLVTFELLPTGAAPGDTTAKPLAENREMLSDGDRYTLVVIPANQETEAPTLRVLEEPTDAGTAGKARLRVVNAARGVETFDVYTPGSEDVFFDDVDFATEAGFKDFDAGSGTIVLRADDNGPVILTVPERAWEAGKTYTIIVTNKGTSGRKLDAITIEDETPATAPAAAPVPAGTPTDSHPTY